MSKPMFYIKMDIEDDEIEDFEIGRNNLCSIAIIENKTNIAKECQIIMWFTRSALEEFGSNLLRWLHFNYSGEVLSFRDIIKGDYTITNSSIGKLDKFNLYCLDDDKLIREKASAFL